MIDTTRSDWKAAGLCPECGDPPVPGRILCRICNQLRRDADRRRRAKLKTPDPRDDGWSSRKISDG